MYKEYYLTISKIYLKIKIVVKLKKLYMKCVKCGKENPENARFCRNCGNDFSELEKNNIISNDGSKNLENPKINNGSIMDWIYPLLYWKNERKNEYTLSKTKIITVIVFLFLFIKIFNHNLGGLLVSIVCSIPVFMFGWGIHMLLNN